MQIIGIDCGSERTGWGIIESDSRRHSFIDSGVIRTSPREPFPLRLRAIHSGLARTIKKARPEVMAIESVFYAANVQTALKLAQVRGVVLLAAAEAEIPVSEYSPLEVKGSVVGYGRATKEQVQMMVASLLHLPKRVSSFDEADALAVSMCHAVLSISKANTTTRPAHV